MKNKVLIIDDEHAMLRAISRQLKTDKEGYEIFLAENGKDGLEIYGTEQPVLVILDIHMPVIDGIEFLQHIRLSSHSPCSVIVLTGKGSNNNIKKCFDLGVYAFLEKPFNNYEFMGLVRNAIALKRAQLALREEIAYRKMAQKALDDQKESFISVLVHDLKNPLIPLAAYSKKLMDGKIKSEKEKVEKLKIIRESTKRLLKIIESTSESLKKGMSDPLVCVNKVVISDTVLFVAKTAMHEAEEKNVCITINDKGEDVWDDLEDTVMCADDHQIRTMIENLLGNAMKYARSRINVDLSCTGDDVKLVINDDGPGIQTMYHKKIFERYFQAPGSREGTGLGLFSVKKVVENHGGKISVQSAPKKGASFKVVLPINKETGRV